MCRASVPAFETMTALSELKPANCVLSGCWTQGHWPYKCWGVRYHRWLSGKESAWQSHWTFGLNPWVGKISWTRKWQPWTEETGGLQCMGSQRVRNDWATSLSRIGEGNGNPLQCSCLENPRDGGAWWAAVYGVAQSRTCLTRLSSSSSSLHQVAKYWSFSISPCNEYSGLISSRVDWSDLLVIQGTLKSLLQPHSWKASFLWCSVSFLVQKWEHLIWKARQADIASREQTQDLNSWVSYSRILAINHCSH